jgi:uncharacterized delta-60 repeat protein
MGTRKHARTNRHALVACLLIAGGLGAVTACGDDDDGAPGDTGGGSGGKGGKGGTSGTSGEGGTSATGGTSGSSGAAGRGGTSGQGGTAGEGGAGSGGEETGGSAGVPGGMGGEGGEVTFWPDGVTANGIDPTVDDRFHGVAFDSSNNVYATGYLGEGVVTSGTSRQVVVAKYGTNGQLVANFGTTGTPGLALVDLSPYLGAGDDMSTTTDDPDPSQETGRDIALQMNGSIIVAGVVEDPTNLTPDRTTPLNIFVLRLTPAGARDAGFNGGVAGGVQLLNPNGNSTNPLAYGVAVDSTDRIYVFAHGNATHATRTDQDRYVYRLNANGTLDATFGTGGFYTFDTPSLALSDSVRRGAVLSDGTVVIAGYTNVAGRNQIVLAQATSDGMPDTTFSGDGIVRFSPFLLGMAECYGVGVQSDGSLVTTGYGNVDTERGTTNNFLDMVSFRVRPDGNVDPNWAGSGSIAYDVNSGEDRGRAILALPDDRILIAGAGSSTATNKDPLLLLLEADGTVAADFDETNHKLYSEFGSLGDEFFSLASSPSGAFVAAAGYAPSGGTLTNGNTTLVIIRAPD